MSVDNSLIDYIIYSTSVYDNIYTFSVMVEDFTQDGMDHFPVICSLRLNSDMDVWETIVGMDEEVDEEMLKIVWKSDKSQGERLVNDYIKTLWSGLYDVRGVLCECKHRWCLTHIRMHI